MFDREDIFVGFLRILKHGKLHAKALRGLCSLATRGNLVAAAIGSPHRQTAARRYDSISHHTHVLSITVYTHIDDGGVGGDSRSSRRAVLRDQRRRCDEGSVP